MSLSQAFAGIQPQPFEACRATLGTHATLSSSAAAGGRRIKPIILSTGRVGLPPSSSFVTTKLSEVTRAVRQLLSSDLALPTSSDPAAAATSPPTATPLITLYQTVDALVSLPSQGDAAASLYERVKMELERAAGTVANVLRAEGSSSGAGAEVDEETAEREVAWLRKVAEQWTEWCAKMDIVENVLITLDRSFLPSRADLMPIKQLSFDILKNRLFEDEHIRERLYSGIGVAVNALRSEQVSSSYRTTHATLLKMAATLDHLGPVQERLLKASETLFAAKAKQAQSRGSNEENPGSAWISQYLDAADHWITTEEEAARWLWTSTPDPYHLERYDWATRRGQDERAAEHVQKRALRIVEEAFVIDPIESIIKELPSLLDTSSPKLDTLYQLLSRPGFTGLPPLRIAFADYIKQRAASIVLDKDRDEEMIERILELKGQMDRVVREFWKGEAELARGLKDAMESAINRRPRKPAEMIAKFVDVKLKSGNKTMTDAELEHVLNEALVLFRYVSDKDMFEEVYKRHFAKRLLLNQSASSDAEQSMLIRLKEECGPGFTQQLETMLKDIALSTEIMQAYTVVQDKARADGGGDPFDLHVFVLTQAHWPTYPSVETVIPGDMSQAIDRFASFYQTRNSGRKLHWQHSLGTNVVKANIGKAGEKELMVSTFQTIVLLLFNDLEKGKTLSYKEIESATKLESKELKRTLQSLACGQIPTRVLRKIPQGKDVDETDEFHVNEGWKNERHRIRINQIQMKETEEEAQETEARVLVDRELVLQAAAVRILKAKKEIRHNDLVNEVIEQVKNRFAVDVGRELKKTFELLIEKDYMERVEGNRGMYRYVA
ncbi:unnamed protein product [Tilletia controversa]|uniref:Cullin family profile domain-containing protein n=3 Tax=Tilletia TaxID=13289 RepID=A0A8X7MY76_9BASI|nr:hypothetical protein CF336_g3784 [Tilletia laevis]KAE8204442.1 hypothetical protein CF328_g1079 [Tilletia controversa]KAE8264723.1 hypothetical protein A4X03_0g748 [Tilletia caries]KAE8206329.1 hypothetical protein CF335_g1975 [Tilletia laevis]KAE8253346.1 hypothetical protein A4X06_0g1525 [Tilletia controversa]